LTCAMGDHMVLIWEVVWAYNSYNGTAGWRRQQWAHLGWHVACAHGEMCERRALKDGLIVHCWISREPKVLNVFVLSEIVSQELFAYNYFLA
jgi:hypothetical protein